MYVKKRNKTQKITLLLPQTYKNLEEIKIKCKTINF